MSTTFNPPTPERRLQVLKDNGELNDRLVRERERQRITSISRSTAWKLEQVGQFPRRKSIGLKSCGWQLSELLCWINER
ncbi:AlpA family phage regulatory protein [Salmonella enterica]|nr:AlpA family phage regulatory protein [Salmonella enterica]EKF6546643.1 AlpA family phage regulatory protein [Salmonella enterica]